MKRSSAREIAFKSIYSKFFTTEENIINEEDVTQNEEFITKILNVYDNNKEEINELISSKLKGYTLNRLFKIDLAILTLAVIELNYIKENPKQVIINEAVELAKKYSTEKSHKFINGVLADIVK